MEINNNIAAISSAAGNSGIGVIRVSGDDAINIIDKIFVPANSSKDIKTVASHTVHYGNIVDNGEIIDEVLVIILKGPHSYTGEDTVEIDSHGGYLVMKKILALLIKSGARSAMPGEFTKRAFLNGRIDLSQAEAVMDVINSGSDMALKSSLSQLKGSIREEIKEIRSDILYHIAYIEAALDDPEHISLDGYYETVRQVVSSNMNRIKKLTDSFDNGRIIREGIKTVILGKPNAGKSSLMNILVGEERAIVTDIAGTTRDILSENIRLGELNLNIIDTAGIRNTDDPIEKIGVNRAMDAAKDCDLIIYVVDGSVELDENDMRIIEFIKDKKAIILLNKADKEMITDADRLQSISGICPIVVSAILNQGFDALTERVSQMFYDGNIDYNSEVYITNIRHKEALDNAYSNLSMVMKSIDDGMPEDFLYIDLMGAYGNLGKIIGENVEDDLVNEIFSKFCMGK